MPTADNPAAAADAEQHVLQEISKLRSSAAGRVRGYAWPAVIAAGAVLSGWLVRRWRRRT